MRKSAKCSETAQLVPSGDVVPLGTAVTIMETNNRGTSTYNGILCPEVNCFLFALCKGACFSEL